MTRINLIPPSELHRKHLQAEYYELPEIFRLVQRRQSKGDTPTTCRIPPAYRFGTGHKIFFYDKLGFLVERHVALVNEMHARGYQASHLIVPCELKNHWFGHYTPSDEEVALSRARIQQRVKELKLK